MNKARLPKDLLVLDVETTGTNPQTDQIIELAAVHLAGRELREVQSFVSRIRPTRPISESAQKVHGITSADLETAPDEQEAFDAFVEFAPTEAILTGHNVGFDVSFLKGSYSRTGHPFDFDYHHLDVWSLAFFILGAVGVSLPKYNLDFLAGLYGIPRPKDHDALSDVRATVEVLRHLFAAVSASEMAALGQFDLFREGR